MRHRYLIFIIVLLASSSIFGIFPTTGENEPKNPSPPQETGREALRLLRRIPLPHVEGRIDHMDLDVKGQRLFVAALGNNTLEVVDLVQGKVIKSVTGFSEPQGIRYLPQSNIMVVANGGDGAITFLNGQTWNVIQSISSRGDADNVRYDARACVRWSRRRSSGRVE